MDIRRLETASDVAAVVAFLKVLEARTGVRPLGESKFVDLRGPQAGRGVIAERQGIVMYLHTLWHEASGLWEMELALDDHRTTEADIENLLSAANLETPMLWWTFGDTGGAAFAASRFQVARQLHKLTGPLPPPEQSPLPDGVAIRAFRPGLDEDAWLETNNAAFEGHPENGAWTRQDIIERQTRDWFEPEGFRLAWFGERVAGFCWTKRHSPDLGEIHVIGVHPDFQGRGIGRVVVIEGLWYLARVGCSIGMLYVDAANQAALELYQSLGLELERIDRCFDIPNGWPHDVQ